MRFGGVIGAFRERMLKFVGAYMLIGKKETRTHMVILNHSY